MAFPTTARLAKMSDDQLLEQLRCIADELEPLNERQRMLWAQRLAVYEEARSRTPVVTHRRLSDAARVSEVAIIAKLKQLAERAGAA